MMSCRSWRSWTVLADDGRGIYGPPENGEFYPAEALTGTGTVVTFHTGYEVDAGDWADVQALCERFDLPIPDDYQRFLNHPLSRASRVR